MRDEQEDFVRFQHARAALDETFDPLSTSTIAAMLGPRPESWAREARFVWSLEVPDRLSALHGRGRPLPVAAPPPPADRARIVALEREVQELKHLIGALIAEREPQAGDAPPPSPSARWIESHRDEIRRYPDSWVVLDPEQGILFHTQDETEFEAHLESYGPKDRARLTLFHTSLYS